MNRETQNFPLFSIISSILAGYVEIKDAKSLVDTLLRASRPLLWYESQHQDLQARLHR